MSKFLEGPWFIWKEEAMRREGLSCDEINDELCDEDSDADLTILAGVPREITRGCVSGIKHVVEIELYYDIEDSPVALATARLIATAPEIFEALTECLKMLKRASDQLSDHPVYLQGTTWGEKEIELAEAAISKVNGESLGLENWLRRNPGHG